jgi:four helix bundle suffix protein
MTQEKPIPEHGGYRPLKSFQVAQLVFDVTVRFCERYIDRFSRTRDQMVQAARSGVQNIAEGSQASATSKKTEIKLTQVARASLEELKLDYEDLLRQRGLQQWPRDDPLRQALVDRRCQTADDVARWIVEQAKGGARGGQGGHSGRRGQSGSSAESTKSTGSTPSTPSLHGTIYPEFSANAVLVLIAVASSLLDRQVASLAKNSEEEGGTYGTALSRTFRAPQKHTTPMTAYSEDALVQQTTAEHLEQERRWESVYAYNNDDFGPNRLLGRTSDREVVLTRAPRSELQEFNPGLPDAACDEAIRQITATSQSLTATVPLYYDARRDKLGVAIGDLNERIAEKLEELESEVAASIDVEQRLEKELKRDYHILTADKRLARAGQARVGGRRGLTMKETKE